MKTNPSDQSRPVPKSSKGNARNSAPEQVGYRKPPQASRFKKGVSGNPSGRPKPKFNAGKSLTEVMSRPVTVLKDGRSQSMPGLEAVFWCLKNEMLKGNMRAIRLFFIACNEFGVSMGSNEGKDKLDELIAAIHAGPVPRGQTNEEFEKNAAADEQTYDADPKTPRKGRSSGRGR